ncbi:MAG: hypothetical protein KF764_00285 [Labilithrix sp.]|nr:hypothetical protein [Labilithrix sp.]
MRRSGRILSLCRPALVLVALAACGSPALRAAEQGDSAKLRSEIASKHERGKLTNDEAADLARAVAEREIATAKDEAAALARLRETRACAAELDDALGERMKKRDGAGAEAALSRLEDGKLGDGDARAWLDDADDRWRAVGARTLHREEDRARRQAAILDPSPRVRRSAIRAAALAKDVTDLDVLFETARVDPELVLRNEALRAMSAIVRGQGDKARPRAAELAVKLRDLWTGGDDAIKEDVAVAWGLAPVFDNGGREALRVAVANEKGPGAIAAAGVVMRSASKDAELVPSASALLARTIADGSRRDRLHALAVAPAEGLVLEAIRKAAEDDDREVRVAVLGRLLDSKPDREAAKKELFAIAGYGVKGFGGKADDSRALDHAARARHALAAAGELRVQAWIEADLVSPEARRKTSAASALAALGRPARAAPLLADPDPSVRTRAACTMMTASRR